MNKYKNEEKLLDNIKKNIEIICLMNKNKNEEKLIGDTKKKIEII